MPGNSYPGGSTGSVTTVNPGGTNNMGTSMTPGNTGMSGNSGYYGQNGMQAGMTAGPGNTNTGSTSSRPMIMHMERMNLEKPE